MLPEQRAGALGVMLCLLPAASSQRKLNALRRSRGGHWAWEHADGNTWVRLLRGHAKGTRFLTAAAAVSNRPPNASPRKIGSVS